MDTGINMVTVMKMMVISFIELLCLNDFMSDAILYAFSGGAPDF